MSKSLTLLLQGLAEIKGGEKNTHTQTGFGTSHKNELANPDIPDMKGEDESAYLPDTAEVHDEFATDMSGEARVHRNGAGYKLNVKQKYGHEDQRKTSFTAENSIDPNVIRSKVDPDAAHPSLSSQSLFSTLPINFEPHSQVSLVKQSRESEYNYRNRFKPSAGE